MIQSKKHQTGLIRVEKRAPARREDADEGSVLGIALKSSFLGMLVGIFSGILLLTIACAAAYSLSDPSAFITPLGIIALMISHFFCGFVASKKLGDTPVLCGILSGGMMTLVNMIAGIILQSFESSGYAFWQSALLHGAAIAFAVFGALAGNVKRKQRRQKRRFGN